MPDGRTTPAEVIASPHVFDVEEYSSNELTVVTTTATWCAACVKHQPLLQFLPDAFDSGQVGIVAFPVDREDSTDGLREFVSRHGILYPVWFNPEPDVRKAIESLLKAAGCGDVLPSSLVIDATGRVLLIQKGIPSVSQLRQLLKQAGPKQKAAPRPSKAGNGTS
jgi:peroxiredoxin